MNWIRKALSAIGLANPIGSIPLIPVGQYPVYPKAELQTFINIFSSNASLYIIVSMIARKFASIPRYVYQINDSTASKQYKHFLKQPQIQVKQKHLKQIQDLHKKAYDETIVEDNPLSKLMQQPNDEHNQDAYYELLATYYLLCGEAFQWLNRGDYDPNLSDDEIEALPILERWCLPPQFVGLIIKRNAYDVLGGELTGYQIINNGQPINLRIPDVLHWRKPNPNFNWWDLSHFRGLSPLYAGLKTLTQDDSITDAGVNMYQHGGAHGALVNVGMDKLSPEQLTSIDKAIDTKVNGKSNKGRIARLPGNWNHLNFGMSAVDMDLIDASDKVFIKICNLYGVNPQVFMTGTTFNNVSQARADLITNLVLPMCCSLRDEENEDFLKAFGMDSASQKKGAKKYTTDCDVSMMPELQEDMEKIATSLVSAWWLTPNMRLEAMGQEKSSDPLMDKVWIPNNLTLIDDAAMPVETIANSPYGLNGNNSGGVSNNNGVPAAN